VLVDFDFDGSGSYATSVPDFTLLPINAAADSRPWTTLWLRPTASGWYFPVTYLNPAPIRVTATWGWASVPTAIKQATLLQANRFYNRRHSPYGIAGSPETGSELRLLARLDVDVALIVQPYVKRWGAV
jgi:hypothetical protein